MSSPRCSRSTALLAIDDDATLLSAEHGPIELLPAHPCVREEQERWRRGLGRRLAARTVLRT